MLYVHKKIIRRILTKLLIIATYGEWEPEGGGRLKIRETRLFVFLLHKRYKIDNEHTLSE